MTSPAIDYLLLYAFSYLIFEPILNYLLTLAVIGILLHGFMKKNLYTIPFSIMLLTQSVYLLIRSASLAAHFSRMTGYDFWALGNVIVLAGNILVLAATVMVVVSIFKRIDKLLLAGSILFGVVNLYFLIKSFIHLYIVIRYSGMSIDIIFHKTLPAIIIAAEAGLIIAFAVQQKRFSLTGT